MQLVKDKALVSRPDEPFRLASGEMSTDYIDAKKAMAIGADLRVVAQAVIEAAGVDFDAVGGMTMGADPIAHAVALEYSATNPGVAWFAVRKQPKKHGRQKMIEGVELVAGMRVLLVDDIVTTGGSILDALRHVQEAEPGVEVVCAVTIVDRGEHATRQFESLGVPYRPVATYQDLGIRPVGAPSRA